jgi:hypothetical protein
MAYDNVAARAELLRRLRVPRQVLLLVGAGSSRFVDYPLWGDLLDSLRHDVVPDDPFPAGLDDLLLRAEFIRTTLDAYPDREDRLRQYRTCLQNIFRPKQGRPGHAPFHRTLVRLPFCGIVTTNYDSVVESAVSYSAFEQGADVNCHTIDLCVADKAPRVFEFLRGLSASTPIAEVLHLHGFWDNAATLILTAADYAKRYGIVPPAPDAGALAGPPTILDTLHRKVLWALLTMRSVVFLGFSLEDPAFQFILDLVKRDFDLAPNPAPHVGLLGAADEEQQERDAARLRPLGVMPVFYKITIGDDLKPNHDALSALIQDIGAELQIPGVAPRLADISARMMRR